MDAVGELGVTGAVSTVGECIGYSGCDGAVGNMGAVNTVNMVGW